MATASRFASSNIAGNGGFDNITNVYADDGVYSTATPGQDQTASWNVGFGAFTSGEIPDDSTIDGVQVEVQWKVDTQASDATLGIRVQNPVGDDISGGETTNTSEPLTDTVDTNTVLGTLPTLDHLRTADRVVAVLRVTRGNTATAFTASVDYVKIIVAYTPPTPSGYELDVEPGALVLTGNAAGLTKGYALACAPGAIVVGAPAVGLLRAARLTAATGALTLTGNAAGLLAGRALSAAAGALSLTGNAAGLVASRRLDCAVGALILTGHAATLTAGSEYGPALPADPLATADGTVTDRRATGSAIQRLAEGEPL